MTVFGIILFALVALGILLFVTRLSWEDVKNGGGYGVRPYLDAIGKQFIFTLLGGVCFVGFFAMTFLITYIKNDEYTGETEKCFIGIL